jgi:hypothetical protein
LQNYSTSVINHEALARSARLATDLAWSHRSKIVPSLLRIAFDLPHRITPMPALARVDARRRSRTGSSRPMRHHVDVLIDVTRAVTQTE